MKENLRSLRRQHRLTQAQMAELIGVSRRSYGLYELGDRVPTADKVELIVRHFGISADWLLRGATTQAATTPQSLPPIPVLGLAECGLGDWYKNSGPLAVSISRPADMADPDAFAILATGTSLQPEGIKPGFVCICSPHTPHRQGDIIYIQENSGHASMKVFEREADGWLELTGYLPPDKNGTQKPYTDRRKRSNIRQLATVVYIKRRL